MTFHEWRNLHEGSDGHLSHFLTIGSWHNLQPESFLLYVTNFYAMPAKRGSLLYDLAGVSTICEISRSKDTPADKSIFAMCSWHWTCCETLALLHAEDCLGKLNLSCSHVHFVLGVAKGLGYVLKQDPSAHLSVQQNDRCLWSASILADQVLHEPVWFARYDQDNMYDDMLQHHVHKHWTQMNINERERNT